MTAVLKESILPDNNALFSEKAFASPVCGIDEVGRGPLAGPVLSACVYIKPETSHLDFWQEITDSKKMTAKKREKLCPLIKLHSFHGIGTASVEEIDRLNIHHATLLAMRRAYEDMAGKNDINPQTALIDGRFVPDIPCDRKHAVIKGDSKSLSIAAASVLAKIMRDKLMADLHRAFPFYGWDRNAGYGTAAHIQGLADYGVTPHHRKSFAPVRAAMDPVRTVS